MRQYYYLIVLLLMTNLFLRCAPAKIDKPPLTESEPLVTEKPKIFVEILSSEAEIYGIPGNPETAAGILPQTTLVELIGQQTGWCNVRLPDDSHGWIIEKAAAIPAHYDPGTEEWVPLTGRIHLQVSSDFLNVRNEGTIKGEVVESIIKGTTLSIVDKKGDWYQVRLPDGTPGWVCEHFVEPYQGQIDPTIGKVYKARGDSPIYAGAGEDRQKIGTLWALKKVIIINRQNDWFEVQLEDGTTGWVHQENLKLLK